jgi:hypothetical protein
MRSACAVSAVAVRSSSSYLYTGLEKVGALEATASSCINCVALAEQFAGWSARRHLSCLGPCLAFAQMLLEISRVLLELIKRSEYATRLEIVLYYLLTLIVFAKVQSVASTCKGKTNFWKEARQAICPK